MAEFVNLEQVPADPSARARLTPKAYLTIEVTAAAIGIANEQIQRVYPMIESKGSATRYLHLPPQLVEHMAEVQSSR